MNGVIFKYRIGEYVVLKGSTVPNKITDVTVSLNKPLYVINGLWWDEGEILKAVTPENDPEYFI